MRKLAVVQILCSSSSCDARRQRNGCVVAEEQRVKDGGVEDWPCLWPWFRSSSSFMHHGCASSKLMDAPNFGIERLPRAR